MNMARMNRGAARLAFPSFEGDDLIELLKRLIAVDEHWIPTDPGCSLCAFCRASRRTRLILRRHSPHDHWHARRTRCRSFV